MAIAKLKALFQHVVSHNFVDENQVQSWAEDATATPHAKETGDGLQVCRFEYTAVVTLDGFAGDPALLLAVLTTWVMENDPDRERYNLAAPQVDLVVRDDTLSDVDISLVFVETVSIVPDPEGPITYRGQRWAIGEPVIFEATSGAVGHSEAIATDAEYVHTP